MQKPMKETRDLTLLDGMLTGDVSGAIERSEARGQQQFVGSDSIPTSWGGFGSDEENDAILVQLGFEIGEPFDDDPIFRPAKLPKGWKKSATSHSMHSDILDAEGYPRIGIFYKAAYYDRSASMSLSRRVNATYDPRHTGDRDKKTMAVTAEGKNKEVIILASFSRDLPNSREDRAGYCQTVDEVDKEVSDWIKEHYPNNRDPLAYWDLDLDGVHFRYEDLG